MSGRTVVAALAVVVCGSAAGCGGDDGTDAAARSVTTGDLTIVGAWARPSVPTTLSTAFYFTVANDGDEVDRLVEVTSARCGVVLLHRTEIDGGVASMVEVDDDDLTVGPGERLVLEPNATHAMCLGVPRTIADGETIEAELRFERAGVVTIPVAIERR
ncbi:MAG: copper chaperone PCu(A)C [Acidimicrobiales bacterium]